MSREDLGKEAKERRAEFDRLSRLQTELVERLESAEQKKLSDDSDFQQDLSTTKQALKKEARDREVSIANITSAIREETQKREEAIEREERARLEGLQRATDSFASALREERRVREKDNLRLESRPVSVKSGMSNDLGGSGDVVASLHMETRAMRNDLGDLQQRLTQTEMR